MFSSLCKEVDRAAGHVNNGMSHWPTAAVGAPLISPLVLICSFLMGNFEQQEETELTKPFDL